MRNGLTFCQMRLENQVRLIMPNGNVDEDICGRYGVLNFCLHPMLRKTLIIIKIPHGKKIKKKTDTATLCLSVRQTFRSLKKQMEAICVRNNVFIVYMELNASEK